MRGRRCAARRPIAQCRSTSHLWILCGADYCASVSQLAPLSSRSYANLRTGPILNVYQNSGLFLLPPFMGHAVFNGTGFPIHIRFSVSLGSASLDFGTDNLPGISTLVTLKAYQGGPGGVLVANISTPGIVPLAGEFPQGTISISAPVFDTLVISGMQPGLAIDNLAVSTVPEPSSTLLAFGAMLVLISLGRRAKTAEGR